MAVITTTASSTNTRITGRWLVAGIALWAAIAALALFLILSHLIALPAALSSFRQEFHNSPFYQTASRTASRTAAQTASNTTLLDVLFLLGLPLIRQLLVPVLFISMGTLIFYRALGNRAALIVALSLTTLGTIPIAYFMIAHPPPFLSSLLPALATFLLFTASTFNFLMLLLYPDGRFVPPWSKWAVPFILAFSALYASRIFLGASTDNPIIVSQGVVLLLVLMPVGVTFQVYRYRHASAVHRQQIKWLILGTVWIIFSQVGNAIIPIVAAEMPLGTPLLLLRIVQQMIPLIGTVAALTCVVAAMIRTRVWEVDFAINRSLVYAVAIALMVVIMGISFAILQVALRLILPGDSAFVAGAISAGLAVGLFNPLRQRIRRGVDRYVYGINIDYKHPARQPARPDPLMSSANLDSTFGGCTNLELIGRGGMGEVYSAYHQSLNRQVAVKVLPPTLDASSEAQRRFMREAQTISRLKHPNIVSVFDFGEQGGVQYLVMEYLTGSTLSSLLEKQGYFPPDRTVRILGQLAAALDYAHQAQVIHRDIKPSNVIVEGSPDQGERVVLMDFGLAKITADSMLTQSGEMVGTLHYIAPEQIQGAAHVDHGADIYALGVLAYQLLTGELPFRHANAGAIIMAHLMQPPPDPRAIVSGLSPSIAQAVQRAMAKKRDQRFTSAGEFVAAMSLGEENEPAVEMRVQSL